MSHSRSVTVLRSLVCLIMNNNYLVCNIYLGRMLGSAYLCYGARAVEGRLSDLSTMWLRIDRVNGDFYCLPEQ